MPLASIFADLATHMQSAEFLLQARHPAHPKAFTRQRKLPLPALVALLLSGMRMSLHSAEHQHICVSQRKLGCYRRHDIIKNQVRQLAEEAGVLVENEPDLGTAEQPDRRRPDLLIHLPDKQVVCDIAVCYAEADTYSKQQPAAVVEQRARDKHSKYSEIATRHDAKQLHFSVSSRGLLCVSAIALLGLLAHHAAATGLTALDSNEWCSLARLRIAVAVQRGNGALATHWRRANQRRLRSGDVDQQQQQQQQQQRYGDADDHKEQQQRV